MLLRPILKQLFVKGFYPTLNQIQKISYTVEENGFNLESFVVNQEMFYIKFTLTTFSPKDLLVKVNGLQVIIRAVRTVKHSEDNVTTKFLERKYVLERCMDVDKVECFAKKQEDGKELVEIRGPLIHCHVDLLKEKYINVAWT